MAEEEATRNVHELPGSNPPLSTRLGVDHSVVTSRNPGDLSGAHGLSAEHKHSSPTTDSNQPSDKGTSVNEDGRIDVDLDSKLVRTLSYWYPRRQASIDAEHPTPPPYTARPPLDRPFNIKLNIVIQVVGSRGDVQPFVALGTELQSHGHRIRLATHNVFADFVRNAGLEFYPIGGDPTELMAYMVKNPGLIPSMESLKAGEIERKRFMVLTMLEGCWESCIQSDPLTSKPFVADAIIANPPSFAHVHCAQALGVPVHLMFTMPWSSTTAFPHPLANLKGSYAGEGLYNQLSYGVVEWLTWQGLGDMVNRWRKSIDLKEVLLFDGPILTQTLKIPFTYCWSPALVPKPADWPEHIDVCGFFFRDAPQYEPPPDLADFLKRGPRPIYIGFGSIVVDNPRHINSIILQALKIAGVRAVIGKGWANLSGGPADQVYYVDECPHEWLFQQVSAVVHHGGAGTTACGLKYGKPTTIIPFFGDQPFWGDMVAKAGAGSPPIHHKTMTADNLAEAIQYCLTDKAALAAQAVADRMGQEVGIRAAAESFHRHLPRERMQCDILPDQPAVWQYSRGEKSMKLSKAAAQILLSQKQVDAQDLKIYEPKPISIEATRWDPVSGGASAVMATSVDMATAITGMVTDPMKEYRIEKYRRENKKKLDAIAGTSTGNATPGAASVKSSSPSEKTVEKGSESSSSSVGGSKKATEKEASLAGKIATASAKSIAGIGPTALKGVTVDIPLAITEGLKSIPGHYDGKVRDHGPITGMKSGAAVAGKTFAWGMIDGVSDLFVQPYNGMHKEGAVGAVKGVGKGMFNLVAKSGAGMFGLFAYNSQGVAKSMHSAIYSGRRKKIVKERLSEGDYLVREFGKADLDTVMTAFAARQAHK